MNTPDSSSSAPGPQSLAQWLTYLESIHPSAIDMGLERVSQVAQRLNIDFSDATVITVAGTNGKGTTCRVLELALLAQGKTVGVYSSPHLNDYRERVRINGELKPEARYCEALQQVESARQNTSLTYFEFGTLAAMCMMQQETVDVVILEVGLGGRLDATNIIDPDLAILTTIGLDHQDWLGDTRELIAVEKAGIARRGKPVIVGELDVPENLPAVLQTIGARVYWAGQDFRFVPQDQHWQWQNDDQQYDALPLPRLPMQNASTALAALSVLGWLPAEDTLRQVMASASLPGRRQQLSDSPAVVADVAHNPQATTALVQWLENSRYERLHLVVGMLKDKAIRDTLAAFAGCSADWYLCNTEGPRGCHADTLKDALPPAAVISANGYTGIVEGYQAARRAAGQKDLILVFGSFLTVADVLAFHSDSSTRKE